MKMIKSMSLLVFLFVMSLATARAGMGPAMQDSARGKGIHHTKIFDAKGKLVVDLDAPNMWTTVGKNASLNNTLDGGTVVTGEAEGNTGGSSTVVTLTLKASQNGQTASYVAPTTGNVLSVVINGGTYVVSNVGVVSCTGTCTNFTASTSTFDTATGVLTLNFTSAGPTGDAATAGAYTYINTAWYHHLITEQSHQNSATCTNSSQNITALTSLTTQTGQLVEAFGCGTSGANIIGAISSGATSTTQTLIANAACTAAGFDGSIIVPCCTGAGTGTCNVGTTITTSAIISFGPTFAAADTMASHANWTEVPSADVTNATAPIWTPNAASSAASITNSSSTANFTMASSGFTVPYYVWGWAMGSTNVLPGALGNLFSEAIFSAGAQPVGFSYVLQDTYTATQN